MNKKAKSPSCPPRTAVAYARYSSAGQRDVSIEQQLADIRSFAKREGYTITLEKCDYSELYILLNDSMMDLNKPVTVFYDGKELFNGKVKRTLENIYDSIRDRGDQDSIFSAKIKVEIK